MLCLVSLVKSENDPVKTEGGASSISGIWNLEFVEFKEFQIQF